VARWDKAGEEFLESVDYEEHLVGDSYSNQAISHDRLGYRTGRMCCGMVFVARQLVEKAREHHDSLFTLFMDLRKAYDPGPREAYDSVPRETYDSGPRETYDSVPREAYDSVPREIYDSVPREAYNSVPRETYEGDL